MKKITLTAAFVRQDGDYFDDFNLFFAITLNSKFDQ